MIDITVIGQFSARVDGQPVAGLGGKHREILTILSLNVGSPVSKERLADLVWRGTPPASYVATLDSYVCVLRRLLGVRAGRASALSTTSAGFTLVPGDEVQVDLRRFHQLAESTRDAPNAVVLTLVEQALDLVTGELAADTPYADWAVRARESFREEVVALALQGAQRANALREYARAERLAKTATAHEPLCEEGWRQLMLAHWFSGQRAGALADYAELRATMSEALGDEPAKESQELYLTILRDTERAGVQRFSDQRSELKALLRLLRQALDYTPGIEVPARDAALSQAAVRALAAVG